MNISGKISNTQFRDVVLASWRLGLMERDLRAADLVREIKRRLLAELQANAETAATADVRPESCASIPAPTAGKAAGGTAAVQAGSSPHTETATGQAVGGPHSETASGQPGYVSASAHPAGLPPSARAANADDGRGFESAARPEDPPAGQAGRRKAAGRRPR